MVQYDTRNWLRLLVSVHGTVLPRIALRVLVVAAFGLTATLLAREKIANLAIPLGVHTLVGVALGLLLVFRTNASYDRFWEGRRLIGSVVNNARDLARQTTSFLDPSATAARARVGVLITAYYATIRRYLRNEREWPELAAVLTAEELAAINATRCPPILVARWLSDVYVAEARAGRLSEQRLQVLDLAISDILDFFGGAERIMKTPVPFAYAHHIKGFLTLFCLTVPMALLAQMGWYTAPASAIVAYAMFGIDEIGVEIEDPFGYDANDLPLDTIGENLALDVAQATG
jgi:putative membrane protein